MKVHAGWAFPDADDFMWREMKADGSYQASHLRMALGFVTDRSVAIDGGAHVGCWSRLMAKAFAQVIAVEPSPDTFEALAANMATFDCKNVSLRPVALGAEAGRVSLMLDPPQAERANTGGRRVTAGDEIVCESIDGWNLPALGFLKLDVEGSEVAALEGAALTLARCRPVVLFEDKGFWRRYGKSRQAPHEFLTGLHYQHVARAGCDEIWAPR